MGSTQAAGFKECVDNGMVSLDTALLWHLQSNHYPPIPSSMVKPCKRAIQFANRGKWDSMISLPVGITWQGKRAAPVSAIIEAHHLDSFLDYEEEY